MALRLTLLAVAATLLQAAILAPRGVAGCAAHATGRANAEEPRSARVPPAPPQLASFQSASFQPAPSQPAPPQPEEPVFAFAWVSDLHLDATRLETTRMAFRWIDEHLAPDFVLFTGDNNSIPARMDPARPEPADVRRHRFFKDFLAAHLKAPAVVIPGDNWGSGFERVFGPRQRSFECCGLHFLLLAPDRVHKGPGWEGLSVLDDSTWAWIRKDLDAHGDSPVIVAIHEPIHPPTFLDAPPLRRLLAGQPHVVAILQGHLHVDLHLQADGKAYLTAPALGPSEAPAFKHILVFPHRLVVRTIVRDTARHAFAPGRHERSIEIPAAYRAQIRRRAEGVAITDRGGIPPRPLRDDPTLAARRWELLRNLSGLLVRDARAAPESSDMPQDAPAPSIEQP